VATSEIPEPATDEPEFVISRVLDAPRGLVWRAFTEPAHLRHWWGPKGFAVLSCEVDLRPGGRFLYHLRSADGQDMWGRFIYRAIAPPVRLVFVVSFSNAEGGVTRNPWNASWPLHMLGTLTLTEQQGRTTLTLKVTAFEATAEEIATFAAGRESMRPGWTGMFEQLEAHLATAQGRAAPAEPGSTS
jgi:uncharacterized protein YndB with AHSA1/START domain